MATDIVVNLHTSKRTRMKGVNVVLLFYKGILCGSVIITGLDYYS
jgi:hypothetical protein